jgi:hypothetical protein
LVQVIAAVLPWALLLGVLAWPLRAWLRRQARQSADVPAGEVIADSPREG